MCNFETVFNVSFLIIFLDPELFQICENGYCYSDDLELGQSVESRANLANLFTGTYSRAASTVTNDQFVIEIDFDAAVTFEALSFKKVAGATDFADLYKNVCLELIDANGDMATPHWPLCTEASYGFDNSGESTESADDDEVVEFNPAGDANNVVKARLIFDTSQATGSDIANNADGGDDDVVAFSELTITTSV